MSCDSLDIMEKIATIGTAIVAISAYGQYQYQHFVKRRQLEAYLEAEFKGRRSSGDKGRRTVLHLVAALGMTEADVLAAAFSSSKIIRTTGQDPDTKRADCIYLEHVNNKNSIEAKKSKD